MNSATKKLSLFSLTMILGCSQPPVSEKIPHVTDVRAVAVNADQQSGLIKAVGTVHFRRETMLGFTSSGRVDRIAVNEGDIVRKHQFLAALDSTTVGAMLASAQAEAERAGAELARSKTLFADGWVTKSRLDNARATLAAVNAKLREARFQAVNAQISAPSSGVILARLAEPSQVVTEGQGVLILGEASGGMVLRAAIPDLDAARLRLGAPAEVVIDAFDETVIAGQVVEIAGRADRTTGTFDCLIALPNDGRLRVGQIGTVRIATRGESTTLLVPASAVFAPRAGDGFVYVVAAGKARIRKLALGKIGPSGIEVKAGLSQGELVIVSGVDRLREGQSVKLVGTAP